jgi:hypothetical protein
MQYTYVKMTGQAELPVHLLAHLPQAAVTVRRPRAKSVPISKVTTFFQVGAVNSG